MKLLRLLTVPFALLAVIAMRLAWPRWKIRLGAFFSERIGHLAGNVSVYLAEREAGLHAGYIDLWAHNGKVCNRQMARMIERVLPVSRFVRTMIICNKLFPGWERHEIPAGSWDRDIRNLQEKYPPPFVFTQREEECGTGKLRAMGIPAGAKWVCLIARDGAYLPGLAYHAYRDSDIGTYMLAAHELAKRGYWVIRMGAKVEKKIYVWSWEDKIIDYATNGMRSDFMDIYLMARCDFCISSGTGLDAVATAFRRPVCFVNYAPIEYLFTWCSRSLGIWKHHEKDGKRMTLAEIYASGLGQAVSAEEFAKAGVTLVDNTPEEMAAVVREMAIAAEDIEATNPYWIAGPQERQADFWRDYPRNVSPYTGKPLHGEIRMRIGREFLKGYA